MSPIQCRLARTALGWGVRDLAAKADVSMQTIIRLEAGEDLRDATLAKVRQTVESAGIIFIDEDKIAGEGVRFTLKSRARAQKKRAK